MMWKSLRLLALLALLAILYDFMPVAGWSQQYTKSDRELAGSMLRDADADVQKHYYDSKVHGIDWRARVQEARKNIETARSMDEAVSEIAALLDSLHDSHTFVLLPPRTHVHDYGFQMEMIGDRCYVVRVRPGSDAEKKGLRQGDEIKAVNDYTVSRQNFRRLVYIVNALRPQPELRLTLLDAASERKLEVNDAVSAIPGQQVFSASGN